MAFFSVLIKSCNSVAVETKFSVGNTVSWEAGDAKYNLFPTPSKIDEAVEDAGNTLSRSLLVTIAKNVFSCDSTSY